MKKLFIILALIIFMVIPSFACSAWVLSGFKQTGSTYNGKMVVRCYYQNLESNKKMSIELPLYSRCPVMINPCNDETETQIIINN